MNDSFKNLVGQSSIRNRLNFALQAQKSGRMIPPFLFVGSHGSGKSQFCRELAKNLKDPSTNKIKNYIEINCGTIKSASSFIDRVFQPLIFDRSCSVLLDEIHELPPKLTTMFLSVFNTEKTPVRRVMWDDIELEFDLMRQTFMFATTEPDKIFRPLASRFERLAIAPYSIEELSKIISLNCEGIDFKDDTLIQMAESLKGTPRDAFKMAEKVKDYLSIKNQNTFNQKDFAALCKFADIKAHGLDAVEIQILRALVENGNMSLNEISSITNLSRTALMNEHERHLLRKRFMRIDGKRSITSLGRKVLENFKTKE